MKEQEIQYRTMRRIFIDSNIYDTFYTNSTLRKLFDLARKLNLIDPVVTHVNIDQINRMPKEKSFLRSSILSVMNVFNTTSTFGHIDDISRPEWSAPAPKGTLEKIIGDQKLTTSNFEDALQAVTALNEDALFITNDHRLWNRCNAQKNGSAMKEVEFESFLQLLTSANPV